MANTKICSRCGRELPISEFSKDKTKKDGLHTCCKQCRKQYYAEHREDILEKQKQYNTEHREDRLEYGKQYSKQYRAEHRENILEYKKQYRAEHREEILEYGKQYSKRCYATLKGYCNKIRNCNIQADRKYGRIGDELPSNYPTVEDYMELLQQVDFYDGKQYDFTEMGLDRINNSLPHTLDNVVPCTTKHNIERQKIPFDVFKAKFTECS